MLWTPCNKCIKKNLDISMWTGAALHFDSSVKGLGIFVEIVENLPRLSAPSDYGAISAPPQRTRVEKQSSKNDCLSSTEDVLALRCLSSTDIFVNLCVSCGKRWAQVGEHRLAFGH